MRPLTIARSKKALMAIAVVAFWAVDAVSPFHATPAFAAPPVSSAAGCAVGGSATNSGNFTAANFNLNGVGVSPSGSLQLNTGVTSLDPNNIVIPFDQDVNISFISEGASHISSFGYVNKTLAETWLHSTNAARYPTVPFPAAQTVYFPDLITANTAYAAANPGLKLVNFIFPYLKDDGASCCDGGNGIFDNLYDPNNWSLSGASISFPTVLAGAPPSTEAQYTAAKLTPNGDGALTSIDSKMYLGKFIGGTELVFFLNDNMWAGSTWYTKSSWNTYAGTTALAAAPGAVEGFSPSATDGNTCDGAGGNSVAYTGTWTSGSANITSMSSIASLRVGECVKSAVAGIPAGAYITAITPAGVAPTYTGKGKTTSGSKIITSLPSTATITVGMTVTSAAGIAAGSTVASVDSATQITMNNNATLTQGAPGVNITFTGVSAASITMSVNATATSAANSAVTFGCNKNDVLNSSTSATKQMALYLDLGQQPPENTGCTSVSYKAGGATPYWVQGYVPAAAATRLLANYGLAFTGVIEFASDGTKATASPAVPPYTPALSPHVLNHNFNHWAVASPPADPFKWLMGVEDWHATEVSGDYDFNDVVVLLERKTGGAAQLTSANAMSPSDAAAYITSVTFGVHDKMPTCAGQTSQIDYFVSIDNGVNWVKMLNWEVVQTPASGGATVTNWTYGTPAETYRQNIVNFSEMGLTGRQLIWKAEYVSPNDTCQPETIGVDISYTAAVNQTFSRSAPTSLGNVMYSASFETPAAAWTDKELRGHLKSERIYDPTNPTGGYAITTNWEAGAVLTAATPSARNILFPDMTVTSVANEVLATGNGTLTTFSGTLARHPLVNTSLSITDTHETFVDVHTSTLQGSLTGTGTINRYTGAYTLVFHTAPGAGVPVKAGYQYYTTSPTMKQLNVANTSYTSLALDSSSYTDSTGFHYTYDFNGSGTASTADGTLEADADWLIQWTRGYKDGATATVKKEWLLAAIDHSAPAIVGAPGMPSFYFGTDVNQTYKDSYDLFRCQQRNRDTLAFVGARDGMLHAFYAGEYRPFWYSTAAASPVELASGYSCSSSAAGLKDFRDSTNRYTKLDASNNKIPYYKTSTGVEFPISRGYYDWKTSGGGALGAPNYGDGSEKYAIIPVDQLSKLKNNKLKGEDRAFVDASPSVAYVQFADLSWHALLISAEGNGGDHVFAIDITDPATPKFLWEFADPDLYRSRSSPSVGIIGRINTSTGPKWVVFFVSGVNKDPTASPSIYAVDVQTGDVIRRVYLDSAGAAGLGGTPSGQPAVIDSDGNGYVDRMYIGTDKGFMYKATLPDNPTAAASDITVCTLYDAGQPIYASPAVSLQNSVNADGTTAFNVVVLFGTSNSPYYLDTTAATYYFYAISDKNARGVCSTGTKQWSFALPAGAQIFASAFATAGRVYFGTTTSNTEDPCAPPVASAGGSTGGIYAMDIKTGATVYSDTSVGNITSTPLVDDEHLYFKSSNGTLQARGGNTFQNQVRQGGGGSVGISSWSELTQ